MSIQITYMTVAGGGGPAGGGGVEKTTNTVLVAESKADAICCAIELSTFPKF
jgi:hypothetical protein